MKQNNADWLYKEYPKTCAPDDFWGQVKRTVKGQAFSPDQINMIVHAICDRLHFVKTDILLDLGCGNGALSKYFFPFCTGVLGVDHSQCLISIAKKNFEQEPYYIFFESDMLAYVRSENEPHRFTKVLCYGAFQYLADNIAKTVLALINQRFANVSSILIGNLPDKDKIDAFYPPEIDYSNLVNDHSSPLGIWRTKNEFDDLAQETGWETEFRIMPDEFCAAHYRYDAILRRG
jgi:cyclopropane fatty-acyl-phospholipid synthase-like methyltransferase